jgi:hypothetical protein
MDKKFSSKESFCSIAAAELFQWPWIARPPNFYRCIGQDHHLLLHHQKVVDNYFLRKSYNSRPLKPFSSSDGAETFL